jgi:hypothetical protein
MPAFSAAQRFAGLAIVNPTEIGVALLQQLLGPRPCVDLPPGRSQRS